MQRNRIIEIALISLAAVGAAAFAFCLYSAIGYTLLGSQQPVFTDLDGVKHIPYGFYLLAAAFYALSVLTAVLSSVAVVKLVGRRKKSV